MSENNSVNPSTPIDWDKTDLVTCIELKYKKPDDPAFNDVYHFIYASQLYGTLFGICGKFDYSELDLKVKGVDLQLLNYAGAVNIGFCDVVNGDIPTNRKKEDVYFGVQGGSTIRSIYVPITNPTTGLPTEIQLTKGVHTRLVFNRVLYALNNFNMNQDVEPSRQLNVPIPNSGFFDTEFHYRSGTSFYNNVLRPGMTGYEPPLNQEDKSNLFLISARCVQSYVNLLYH